VSYLVQWAQRWCRATHVLKWKRGVLRVKTQYSTAELPKTGWFCHDCGFWWEDSEYRTLDSETRELKEELGDI
jgi:hypothetical protein